MNIVDGIERAVRRSIMSDGDYRLWKANDQIRQCQPTNAKAKVIIVSAHAKPFNTRGKVRSGIFFPPFCRVLAKHGLASVFVHDLAGLEREVRPPDGLPIIVIDLVNELYDPLDRFCIPENLASSVRAIFNSRPIAKIIRDKREANLFFSRNGILMPRLDNLAGKRIFSNLRVGSKEAVFLFNDIHTAPEGRYNAEFIDTTARIGDNAFYTTVRLMCVGPCLLQAYVRARNVSENNPSVHNADTPQDRALSDRLYDMLIRSRLEDYVSFARAVGNVLGPGFYAHDILVDNDTGGLVLCESGFKFFDESYWERIRDIVDGRDFQYNVFNQENYAQYAAAVFVGYCSDMKFLDPDPQPP